MSLKNQYLQIRVNEREKTAIQQAAARANMDMSRWALQQLLPHRQRQYQDILHGITKDPEQRRFLLAELNNLLSQINKDDLALLMQSSPDILLDSYMLNYIAAMLETTAHQLKVPVSGWPLTVQPLEKPVFVTELTSLRLHLLTHSPPAFRRRNIFIDSSIGERV